MEGAGWGVGKAVLAAEVGVEFWPSLKKGALVAGGAVDVAGVELVKEEGNFDPKLPNVGPAVLVAVLAKGEWEIEVDENPKAGC